MLKFFKIRTKKTGLPPGTLVHIGDQTVEPAQMQVIDYNPEECTVHIVDSADEIYPFKDSENISWINIDGVHNTEIIEKVGEHFNIHSLTLEDIVSTGQRPKVDDYDNYLYIVFKMFALDKSSIEIKSEQVSIILSSRYLLSFQETHGDVFDNIRNRLKLNKGRLRKMGTDYLAYSLIDTAVDHYYVILEKLGEKIEQFDEMLFNISKTKFLQDIQDLKREILFFRKSVMPLHEVIETMRKGESDLVSENTRLYLNDLHDHIMQIIDTADLYLEMISWQLEIYFEHANVRMNEIMKVLTIMASIGVPITVIASIYGMNFQYMPELHWKWGYPMVWGAMILTSISLLLYFKKRKWL